MIERIRLDATADDTKVGEWVNQVYAEVCIETEALQDTTTITLVANTKTYTPAAGIVRIKQMYVTPSGQSQSRPLVPTSVEQILEWSASNGAQATNTGTVTHYAQVGIQNLLFYPTPSSADTVTVYYVKLPTALSASGDVPVLQEPYVSSCLIEGAAYKAGMFLKDPDTLLYKQNYEEAMQKLRGHLRRREGSMTRQFRLTRGSTPVPHDRSTDVGW